MACSVLGISARFRGGETAAEFWDILATGGTLVGEQSQSRRRLTASRAAPRWGGVAIGHYLDDIDAFDRRLFSLSPSALLFADPRQRLLLEATWAALDDAGIARAELAGSPVGVFVAHDGWYLGSYARRIPAEQSDNQEFIVPGNDPCFLANRISSVFDFHGPSMAFDTTCSGALVALHHACRALDAGECDTAIVAAVTLFLDPFLDGKTTATPFESRDAQMRSFRQDADGYCTSEGCGAIVLKRSTREVDARHDVRAQVLASGYNCGGRTNSFAQPSRALQSALFARVLRDAALAPAQIGYVEAHGVASPMGDAIEANALIEALGRGPDEPPCHVGTIKPNLGHNHAASGIYTLLKVMLSLRHEQIAPIRGLADGPLNEAIDADTRGLRFATEAVAWPAASGPRYALLSSYGMSNVNAAIVIGGPSPPRSRARSPRERQYLVCLSAQSAGQLAETARRLDAHLARETALDLADVAYTLQAGREAHAQRWVAIVDSIAQLRERLAAFGADVPDVWRGDTGASRAQCDALMADRDALDRRLVTAFDAGDYATLAQLWTLGVNIRWDYCYGDTLPRRVALPAYPFARERYWVDTSGAEATDGIDTSGAEAPGIHPLLQRPLAQADGARFRTSLRGDEFFLDDHRIEGHRILPAVAHLELARALAEAAEPSTLPRVLTLRNVAWTRPLRVADGGREIEAHATPRGDGWLGYAIADAHGARETFSEGGARFDAHDATPTLDVAALRARMTAGVIAAADVYAIPERLPLVLGPRIRGLRDVALGERELYADIVLPDAVAATAASFGLHPSVMDPLLQIAYLGLVLPLNPGIALTIPFALREARVYGRTGARMGAWIRYAAGSSPGDAVQKLDVDLCDADGRVCLTLRDFSFRSIEKTAAASAVPAAPVATDAALTSLASGLVREALSTVFQLPPAEILPDDRFDRYGIESTSAVRLTHLLEARFGSLTKTLFFEYRTLRDLAAYFVTQHAATLRALGGGEAVVQAEVPQAAAQVAANDGDALDIAIVGLAGRYPNAPDLDAYWNALRDGVDCIVEVPASRWNWRDYFSEDRAKAGSHYSRWGGFIDDVDRFDALLFGIPPREAELLDPQERLFLQHAWIALEDAGYSRDTLRRGGGNVGVYAAAMYGEYQLYGAEASLHGERIAFASTLASIANRVSYTFDLHGPSMMVDTKCSGSLTAIHLACQDLRLGNTQLAIAGGVNLTLHPNKYLELSRRQFISGKGRCEAFGEGGDGYVPGEGVGVAVLKRLADAVRDGDHVYGVIKGSAINHGGRTNGYTVPNPQAQQAAIAAALRQAGADPRDIGYVEAHGTGTRLGDPIEIAGLAKAFDAAGDGGERQFCWIGSAKSNIGHCESAAGIAGLTKVLLQLRHGQIAPSLHTRELNPHIDFAATPFKVSRQLQAWPRTAEKPRLAGLSSFGAGGSNAHLVIADWASPTRATETIGPALVPLSARDDARLAEVVAALCDWLRTQLALEPAQCAALADVAYTLQVGREPFESRLAVLADSLADLLAQLEAHRAGRADRTRLWQGDGDARRLAAAFDREGSLDALVDEHVAARRHGELLQLWTRGLAFDWNRCYDGALPRRVSLPTYPFARERCWFDAATAPLRSDTARLHPLLHRNTSDLAAQRYASRLDGNEAFLADHRVHGRRVLPAAVQLELSRAAVALAAPGGAPGLCLRDIAWVRPIVADGGVDVELRLYTTPGGADIELAGTGGEPCMRGRATWGAAASQDRCDLDALRARTAQGRVDATALYARFAALGIDYGPAQRGVVDVRLGHGEALAQLRAVAPREAGVVLDPCVVDAALQACLTLLPHGDGAPVPASLALLRVDAPCPDDAYAWIRSSNGGPSNGGSSNGGAANGTFDIDLCDADGHVCASLRGLATRSLVRDADAQTLLYARTWRPSAAGDDAAATHWLIVAGVDAATAQDVAARARADAFAHIPSSANEPAQRAHDVAVSTFAQLKEWLAARGDGPVFVQTVCAGADAALLGAVSGLLKTAALEHASLRAQTIECRATDAAAIATAIAQGRTRAQTQELRVDGAAVEAAVWQPVPIKTAPAPWVDGGVYLVSGGLGGLGLACAREIVATADATVVLLGRSAPDAARRDALAALGGKVEYRAVDVADAPALAAVVADVVRRHGAVRGVIHCAGVLADGLLASKHTADFARVLAPKIAGAAALDAATREQPLDCFVLFASVAGALGNAGQGDYAAANAFLDRYADYRNDLVRDGARRGRTLALDWPLWRDGGMRVDAAVEASLARSHGMTPLPTDAAFAALRAALAADASQVLVLHGDAARLASLVAEPAASVVPAGSNAAVAHDLREPCRAHVAGVIARGLKLAAGTLRPDVEFARYGVDSVLVTELAAALEADFGAVPKTLLYQHPTLNALTDYFLREHAGAVAARFASPHAGAAPPPAPRAEARLARPARVPERSVDARTGGALDIAIVGASGRYPQARDLAQFWNNLESGKDCITQVPAQRWDVNAYADGAHASRWGGFIDGIDEFDAVFFGIAPARAALLDPQERLFLQEAWNALEDAGYAGSALHPLRGEAGVYVGAMYGEYQLFGPEAGSGFASSNAAIANRVSHTLDLAGPSLAVDTMCSSSLTAIHLACLDLAAHRTSLAIAGGVNLSLHPNKYRMLTAEHLLSSSAQCASFGPGSDGYVPGEGVGAVVLRRLCDAERDGDRILGVIRASALNHGGRGNGYGVPSPAAQRAAIARALDDSGVPAARIGYVEAHGTGTTLGDAIEFAALADAFGERGVARGQVRLGSVKSNIGHGEAAAGIAALSKVLLQLRHGRLAPSINASTGNPNIAFDASPFVLNRESAAWPRPVEYDRVAPRAAGISAFGAGGSNAHLIVEEYVEQRAFASFDGPFLVPLSAHTDAQLRELAARVVAQAQQGIGALDAFAYTLQTGRAALDERLAVVAGNADELAQALSAFLAGGDGGGRVWRGRVADDTAPWSADEDLRATVDAWLAKRKFARLAQQWVRGLDVDWSALYANGTPCRVAAPTMPFARDSHWWSRSTQAVAAPAPVPQAIDLAPVSAPLAERVERLLAAVLRNAGVASNVRLDAATRLGALALESLQVASIAAFLRSAGCALPPAWLYTLATVGELRDRLIADALVDDAVLRRAAELFAPPAAPDDTASLPLLAMQQAFVVGRAVTTLGRPVGSTIYVELASREPVDAVRLAAAWQVLVARHDALRVRIADGRQHVVAADGAPLPLTALATLRERVERGFDLAQPPYHALALSDDGMSVHLALDEAIADAYSASLLIAELERAYRQPHVPPAPLALGYRDVVQHALARRDGPAHAESLVYWRAALADAPPAPHIAHASQTTGAATVCLAGRLDAAAWTRLQRHAQAQSCYPSALLLTVFCDVLRRHTGQGDFSLGVTHLNRDAVHADVMRVVGLFMSTSVFVSRAEPAHDFDTRMRANHARVAADSAHAGDAALDVLRERRAVGAALALPVVFTSLVGGVFEGLPADAPWHVSDVLNTTPQVHLDHQTMVQDGALVWRWYVAGALAEHGAVRELFDAYGRALQELSAAATDTGFALTSLQTAYAFGRAASYRHGGKSCVFHEEYTFDTLDVERLEAAWNRVVAEHPMLRTSIGAAGRQRLLDTLPPVAVDVADAQDAAGFDALCERTRERLLGRVYPLDGWPYFALAAVRDAHGGGRVFVNIDLVVADGRSLLMIVAQWFALYADPAAVLPAQTATFRDAVALRAARRAQPDIVHHTEYWRHKFAELPAGPAAVQNPAGIHARTRQLGATLPDAAPLHALARRLGTTLNTVLLAAYGATLLEWNAQAPFGVVVVNWDREPEHPQFDTVVGDFTRLAWVAFEPGARDAAEWVRRTQHQLDRDAMHRNVDGLELLRLRPDLSYQVVYTSLVDAAPLPASLRATVRPVYAISHTPNVLLDNIVSLRDDGSLRIQWDTLVDDHGQENAMFQRYVAMLHTWANEAVDAAPEPVELPYAGVCLYEPIEAIVARWPERVAIRDGERSLTYAELDRASARCANALIARGVQPDDVVAVCMERSADLVIALLGIVRAGAAYLPLDVAAPMLRVATILDDAGARVLLTQRHLRARFASRAGLAAIALDDDAALRDAEPRITAARSVGVNHLAYVIYTSGSTGTPKGCMIEHRAIVNRLAWMQAQFPLRPGDRVLLKTPYTFDVSVWEFFWPLMVGATIVVAKPQGHLDANYLLDLIARERIDVCHFVPSMLRAVLREPKLARMAGMQRVVVSGEALEYDLLEEFERKVGLPLENLYGPTEAAVDVSWWRARRNSQRRTTIGQAITGITLHILDEAMRPVVGDASGDLYISGVGVGRGYLNNPALTARSFVDNPFAPGETLYRTGDVASRDANGDILYHGRADSQVKLNGLRIELEEIEHHLREHATIADAMVAVVEMNGQKLLAAYCVAREARAQLDVPALRTHLAQRLPQYMIPHVWTPLDAIPLTVHGKRNRKDLPGIGQEGIGRAGIELASEPAAASTAAVPATTDTLGRLQALLHAAAAHAGKGA